VETYRTHQGRIERNEKTDLGADITISLILATLWFVLFIAYFAWFVVTIPARLITRK
jgi:hypothetical protein